MLEHCSAPRRALLNVVEWTNNNACIARDETAYLDQEGDLMSVVNSADDALDRVEEVLEDAFIRFRRSRRRKVRHDPLTAASARLQSLQNG